MITVIIERHLADDMIDTYEAFARKVMQAAVEAPGFISGESFHRMDAPDVRFLIVKMRTAEDWQRWQRSPQRSELISQLQPTLKYPEKITLLSH